jgi:hypothetical protein
MFYFTVGYVLQNINLHCTLRAVRLVAGLSPLRRGLIPGPFHVGFVADKVALEQVYLRVLRFPVSINSPTLHSN